MFAPDNNLILVFFMSVDVMVKTVCMNKPPVFLSKSTENLKFQMISLDYILKETSNAKSELLVIEWTPRLCLCFVLFHMRLVNIYIIAINGVMNYSLLRPNVVAFYAKQNEISKIEFHFAFEVSFSI